MHNQDYPTPGQNDLDSIDLWAKAYAIQYMANAQLVRALRDGKDLPPGWRLGLSMAFVALSCFYRRMDDSVFQSERAKQDARREWFVESLHA